MKICECGTTETSSRAWRLQMGMCRRCYTNWKKAQMAAKELRRELKSASK